MEKYNVKPLLKKVKSDIAEKVSTLEKTLSLALLLGKEGPDAIYYADSLIKKGTKLGFKVELIHYNSKNEWMELFNSKLEKFTGILPLAPYPEYISGKELEMVPFEKDVDASNILHLGHLFAGLKTEFAPATALSAFYIAKDHFHNELKGKDIVIVGRSLRVGKPLIPLFLSENATVTICHSKTVDLPQKIKRADIVICAIGRGNFFKSSMFRTGQLIVDVGINRIENGFSGDVDMNDLEESRLDVMVTPVPGGVGSLTSYLLYKNLLYLNDLQK
ncbi:bifunctional 5,10-methylenetetrahydrofolate dehydrogenase/5,10-methenyltetrahydrofolate cyclohydrolase [bacterium]|nr:bifunctional 5,10-methylenetetrahydrofolate dehydrogenase/5,10-methenyltetrahydrofolate cyclohydrolase [bacterium]